MESKSDTFSQEERVMAALAHGSVLLSLFGPLGPVLVWISQRRKSRYAAFQALQAMGYQALVLWIGLSVALIGVLVFVLSVVLPSADMSMKLDALPFDPLMRQAVLIQNILLGIWAVLCLPGLVGAGVALAGRDFHYPWLGRKLEAWLHTDSPDHFNEAREDDWVAGICHSSAVVVFWGMILPWLVWTTQKERSLRLRFQALQAFLFQLLMVAAFIAALIVLTGMMVFVILLAQYMNSPAGMESDAGLYLIIAVFVMLFFVALMLLSLPTFHLFALIAWVRVARGEQYRYPVVGKRLKVES